MKRREAIRKVVLGGVSAAILPGIIAGCEKEPEHEVPEVQAIKIDLNAPEYAQLNQAGGSIVLSEGIIVANSGLNGFIAASSKCPHNGGMLRYNGTAKTNEGVWRCPGHCSGFTFYGKCLCGPSEHDLKTYPVFREKNSLTIYG
jgi:Rieske Fe-S protein